MSARVLSGEFLVAFSLAGEERDLVRAIAKEVERRLGSSKVFFDEWFEHYLAGHDGDKKLQKIYGERCALAVVCVSESYGDKSWTQVEHEAIRERVMQARATKDERTELAVLPIRVGDGDVEGIRFNTIVPDVREKTVAQAADLIVERLRLIVPSPAEEATAISDWPEQAPPLSWPVADHSEVRVAFENLLTRSAPWRLLALSGPSESGKSYITRQMLGNVLRMPSVACGRFDFKGTTDMDAELRAFIQQLEVSLPPASPRLNERLSHIFDTLKLSARPTLLIFDTYEVAGEAEDWVKNQLLPGLIRATWLRVVIAGQKVPKSAGAILGADSAPPMTLKPPPPTDWYEYGKQHRPELTLKFVEDACHHARNKASLLNQLLGPVT